MVLRPARFVLVLAVATVAAWCWWFSPIGDAVRLVAHDDHLFDFDTGDRAEAFTTPDQLRAAYPARWAELAADLDWNREKLVRVRFTSVGYRTEETVDGETRLSETQFGEPAATSRFGGRSVRFCLYCPTPDLIGGTVHSVFHQQQQISWFAVPHAAETRLSSEPADLARDGLFVLSLITIWGASFAQRRRWRLCTSTERRHTANVLPD